MTDGPKQNDADAVTAEASNSAESDLDSLIDEYNGEDGKPAPTPDVSRLLETLKPVVRHVEADMLQKRTIAQTKAVDDAVAAFKNDDAVKNIDDEIALGYMMARHDRDPVFKTAFENRLSDPGAWDKVLEGARNGLIDKMGVNTVRSDIEAAAAAVAGVSVEQPSPEDGEPSVAEKFSMSDTEWRAHKEAKAAMSE